MFNEINANTDNISVERAKTIELAILDSFFDICLCENAVGEKFYNEFEFISYGLLKKLGKSECCRFIINTLEMDDFARIISFVPALRYIEMDHGKIESGYRQESVISEIELKDIEQSLCVRVDNYLEDHILYDIPHWVMLNNLLERIKPCYFNSYFKNHLDSSDNILKFLRYSISLSHWTSLSAVGWSYKVNADYKDYLTKEEILYAINEMRANQRIHLLPMEIQRLAAAFVLDDQGETEDGEVSREKADELLNSWKKECDTIPQGG